MLEIEGLSQSYGGQNEIAYPNWKVEKEETGIILGHSGCGKTTLLHLIGGLMSPKTGKVAISGQDLSKLSKGQLDQFRGRHIGIVFQQPHLIRSLTVQENLYLALYLAGKKQQRKPVMSILERLDIVPLAKRKVHEISQGQAQRVSIARAVIHTPKLLLADEPTASLDDENCQKVVTLLKSQAEEAGATLIVATHDHRVKSAFKNQLVL